MYVSHSGEIPYLGWQGNHAADCERFNACRDYIVNRAPSLEEQKRAMYNMTFYGMGIDEIPTDEQVKNYIAQVTE